MNRMTITPRSYILTTMLLVLGLCNMQPAVAARGWSSELPLSFASMAAEKAIAACAAKGFSVSAAVVDAEGQLIAFARGDGATPHTKVSSFRKAYTVVTLGPVFGFSRLGEFATTLRGKPQGEAIATLPDILLLAGGIAIEKDGAIVGALGVGGAPGGDKDEACAKEALEAVKSI